MAKNYHPCKKMVQEIHLPRTKGTSKFDERRNPIIPSGKNY
jgi:hypothetical protein